MVVGGIERWCRSVVYYRWFMSCCILGVRFLFFLLSSFCHFEWMRWLFIGVVRDLVVIVQSVLDSVVIVALYFLYNVVILILSWCCVLLSSSFVVYWEWGLYSQVVHSDPVGYLESLSTVVQSLNAYDMEPSEDLCRWLQWPSVTEWDLSSVLIIFCWYQSCRFSAFS